MSDIPEWAIEEFCKRAGIDRRYVMSGDTKFVATRVAIREGGRLIAEHEEVPVDPLLVEAQELADQLRINLSAMPWVEGALLAALRRGMELARETQP